MAYLLVLTVAINVWPETFSLPLNELERFDSSFMYDVSGRSSYSNDGPTNLFWAAHRSAEPSDEEQKILRNRNIVHLAARPLQIYYHDDENIKDNATLNLVNSVCRVRVQTKEIYTTLDTNGATVDLLFLCSGSCCGLDCCHPNLTLIVALTCIAIAILGFIGYSIAAVLADFKLAHKVLPCLFHKKRIRREIHRTNATRKHQHRNHQAVAGVKRQSQTSISQSNYNLNDNVTRKDPKSITYLVPARKSITGIEPSLTKKEFKVEISRETSKSFNYKRQM